MLPFLFFMRPDQGYHALYNVPLSDVMDIHSTIMVSLEVEWVIVIWNWNHVVFRWPTRRELVITKNHDDSSHYPCNKINNSDLSRDFKHILPISEMFSSQHSFQNSASIVPLNFGTTYHAYDNFSQCLSTFIKMFIAARVWSSTNDLNKKYITCKTYTHPNLALVAGKKWVLLVYHQSIFDHILLAILEIR